MLPSMWGDDRGWRDAAAHLGLALHDPASAQGSFHAGASFEHLKRAMGAAVAREGKSSHWMYGRRRVSAGRRSRDVEVFVLVNIETHGSSTTTYTRTIARIDPSLLLGLAVRRASWIDRAFGAPKYLLGDAELDASLRVEARSPRAAVLLTTKPGVTPSIGADIATLRGFEFAISDGSVDLYTSSGVVTDAGVLAWRLDTAASLAIALEDADARLPRDPDRAALAGAWATFADVAGLTFDARRMRLGGVASDARFRIALEGDAGVLYTAITVELPRSLGLGLRMKPQGALQFLSSLFGAQDIELGDAAFDARFVIEGAVPAKVRAALASPVLRRALLELAHGATDVRVDDVRLFFRYPIVATSEGQLGGLVERIRIVVDGFFPRPAAVGPYR